MVKEDVISYCAAGRHQSSRQPPGLGEGQICRRSEYRFKRDEEEVSDLVKKKKTDELDAGLQEIRERYQAAWENRENDAIETLRRELISADVSLAYHTFRKTGDNDGCDDALIALANKDLLVGYIAILEEIDRRKHANQSYMMLERVLEGLKENPILKRLGNV
jgi:hypothetical protein